MDNKGNRIQETTGRNSNFEFLRILSMFLIVLHHFSAHGSFQTDVFSGQKIAADLLFSLGKSGVNIFILISSYFLVSKEFKVTRVLTPMITTFFYSASIFLIFYFFKLVPLSPRNIISSFFPIPNSYWFVDTYVLLVLLAPFLNIFIQTVSKQKYQYLLLFLSFIWVILPSFINQAPGYTNFSWFIFLYLLVGYYKKEKTLIPHKYVLISLIVSLLLIVTSVIIFNLIGTELPIFSQKATFLTRQNKIPPFIFSCSLLLLANSTQFKNISIINKIAASTFGIYLIHDNPLVRKWLWHQVVDNSQFTSFTSMIFFGFLYSLIIFISCSFIELLRRKIFMLFFSTQINRLSNKISSYFKN